MAQINIRKANMLPPSEQARVATYIPLNQWGPSTKALIRQYYPNIDMSRPPVRYLPWRQHRGRERRRDCRGAPATTVPAGSVPPPPVGVGGLLGALNAPGASGKSTMDNLGSEFGGEQQPPANLPDNLQGQQAAASGNIRQQQIYQESQPTIQAMAHAAAPPTGTPPRPNTVAYFGGQPVPVPANLGLPPAIGTTLNSQGFLYGQ